MVEITCFYQKETESLYNVWKRNKLMIKHCLSHKGVLETQDLSWMQNQNKYQN